MIRSRVWYCHDVARFRLHITIVAVLSTATDLLSVDSHGGTLYLMGISAVQIQRGCAAGFLSAA